MPAHDPEHAFLKSLVRTSLKTSMKTSMGKNLVQGLPMSDDKRRVAGGLKDCGRQGGFGTMLQHNSSERVSGKSLREESLEGPREGLSCRSAGEVGKTGVGARPRDGSPSRTLPGTRPGKKAGAARRDKDGKKARWMARWPDGRMAG